MSSRLRSSLAVAGALALVAALLADSAHARSAAAQAWPPFVLVAGLLLIGLVAHGEGLFDAAAARVVRLPGPPAVLLVACYGLVALVTAVLNLDTAAVFLTPVLIAAARRRGVEATAFLFGAAFMANASSLFLPGSNLTNLLVLAQQPHVSGGAFAVRMLPVALTCTLVTAAALVAIYGRRLAAPAPAAPRAPSLPAIRIGPGLTAAIAAAVLMVVLRNAALPVLAIGLAAVGWRLARGELSASEVRRHVNLPVLFGLFGVAVGLGTLARGWSYPAHLMRTSARWSTALIAAGASALINNLPAAVLLSSQRPAHPRALLLGLNIGPNLLVTGALSGVLWLQSARVAGARPSAREFTRVGVVLVGLALASGLAVLQLGGAAG